MRNPLVIIVGVLFLFGVIPAMCGTAFQPVTRLPEWVFLVAGLAILAILALAYWWRGAQGFMAAIAAVSLVITFLAIRHGWWLYAPLFTVLAGIALWVLPRTRRSQ